MNSDDFWDDVILAMMTIMVTFCLGGIVLGVLFSPAARVAVGIWAALIGTAMLVSWAVNR